MGQSSLRFLSHPLFFAGVAALIVCAFMAACFWWHYRSRRKAVPKVKVGSATSTPPAIPSSAAALPTLISIENPVEAVRQTLHAGDLAAAQDHDNARFLDTSPQAYELPDESAGRLNPPSEERSNTA